MGTAYELRLPRYNRHVSFCDFCGSHEGEALALIGPSHTGAHICAECVKACVRAVEQRRVDDEKKEPTE